MSQEATMICVDNSEWMRNGDFSPSRFESQLDAVNIICGAKTRANAENTVGLLTTAGRAVEVHVTLTTDPGKMIAALHKIKLGGETNIMAAIQVAQLALRNRQNKGQEQRIIIFVGSPLNNATAADLKKIGASLKKNKVAVDIVNFGEDSAEGNEEKLRALHEAVNNHDNSNFVTIPPGSAMLADALHHTRIIRSGAAAGGATGAGTGGAAGAGGGEPDFGIDPNLDPELAIALRLSMETAEQERRTRGGDEKGNAGAAPAAAPASNPAPAMEVDDPEMAEALRLSMMTVEADNAPSSPAPTAPAPSNPPPSTTAPANTGSSAMEEDDELKKAMELSRQTADEDSAKTKPKPEDTPMDTSAISQDELASILKNLPGVDFSVVEQEMKKKEQEEKEKKKDQ